jgi:hypothetical protein
MSYARQGPTGSEGALEVAHHVQCSLSGIPMESPRIASPMTMVRKPAALPPPYRQLTNETSMISRAGSAAAPSGTGLVKGNAYGLIFQVPAHMRG